METPEMEFLIYLLTRYLRAHELEPSQLTVSELIDKINRSLTPL